MAERPHEFRPCHMSLVRRLNWMTENSTVSEARLPSIPTPKFPDVREHRKRGENVSNLPTSATCIILTSFHPPPIQRARFFMRFRMRWATLAFWVGEHLQATTVESLVAISMNPFVNNFQTNLEVNQLHAIGNDSHPDLEIFSADNKTAIQFLLQKLQPIPSFVEFLTVQTSQGVHVSLDPVSKNGNVHASQLDGCPATNLVETATQVADSISPPVNIRIPMPAFLKVPTCSWLHPATYPAPEVLLDIIPRKHPHHVPRLRSILGNAGEHRRLRTGVCPVGAGVWLVVRGSRHCTLRCVILT